MKSLLKLLFLSTLFIAAGCEEYLDQKPDKKMVVPVTIQDAQALLDNTRSMNIAYPSVSVLASDNLYMLQGDWETVGTTERNSYIWESDVFNDNEHNAWSMLYVTVYTANVILDALEQGDITNGSETEKNNIKGQALFFRSYAFYHLLQVFAQPWNTTTAETDLGIALRLSPDLNIPTTRATVQECYDRLISDTKESISLLPDAVGVLTRPTKAAANAFLARVYLGMGDFENAFKHATLVLETGNSLINYNTLDSTAPFPFEKFNKEVLLHTLLSVKRSLFPPILKVDTLLLRSYSDDDLRRSLFFQMNADGSYGFKGSYDGSLVFFNGPATNELYLIRAECYARNGKTAEAMAELNELLITRWRTGAFEPFTAGSSGEALAIVLRERRKELVFRGLRWTDLRRLNMEPDFAKTIKRVMNGKEYILSPNSNQYVFPLPDVVVQMTGIEQNPR